jgi:hypothetical protein
MSHIPADSSRAAADAFQTGDDRLAVFVRRKPRRIAGHARPRFGFGKYGGCSFGKSGRPVRGRQENVLNPAGFEFVHNARAGLRLATLFLTVCPYRRRQTRRFLDRRAPVPNINPRGVHEQRRIKRFKNASRALPERFQSASRARPRHSPDNSFISPVARLGFCRQIRESPSGVWELSAVQTRPPGSGKRLSPSAHGPSAALWLFFHSGGRFSGLAMFFISKPPGLFRLHSALCRRLGKPLHYPFRTVKSIGAVSVLENLIHDFFGKVHASSFL